MILDEIVNKTILENVDIECKSRLDRNNAVGWLKTIAGFANNVGGFFYIGVEDKTNKLIGFDRIEVDKERNYFNNMINQHIYPRPNMNLEFLKYKIHNEERYIIFVNVLESNIKPIIVKFDNIPSVFIRRNGFTNGATYEELILMSRNNKNYEYDMFDTDIPFDKKDFTQLYKKYYENNNKELSEKALISCGFINSSNNLKNGSLLFKDNVSIGKTCVQLATFNGFTKGDNRIVSLEKIEGSIIECIYKSFEYVKQRMNHSMIKLNEKRIDIAAFPERALFEGIVNAFAHRDYSIDNSQIQIDLFKDRLEISSPGFFLDRAITENFYDLTAIISRRRNMLVCEILKLCKMMEAGGTGFDKIVEEYKDCDQNHKPYIFSKSNQFNLVLPDLTYEDGVNSPFSKKIQFVPVPDGSQYDEKVLVSCLDVARRASEIASELGITNSTYFRNKVLQNLVKHNYLIEDKVGATKFYKTNKDNIRLM